MFTEKHYRHAKSLIKKLLLLNISGTLEKNIALYNNNNSFNNVIIILAIIIFFPRGKGFCKINIF